MLQWRKLGKTDVFGGEKIEPIIEGRQGPLDSLDLRFVVGQLLFERADHVRWSPFEEALIAKLPSRSFRVRRMNCFLKYFSPPYPSNFWR